MALTQIKTTAIADDAVTTDKLANAINTERTANTAKVSLENDSVTGAKIADDAVGAEHIEDLDSHVKLLDNSQAIFGTGSDLKIYHDGTRSWIQDANAGNLIIDTNGTEVDINSGGNAEYMGRFIKDGAVEIYFDNSKKFETTSTGAYITGTVTSTGGMTADHFSLNDNKKFNAGSSDDLQIYHDGSNSYIKDTGTGGLAVNSNHFWVADAANSDYLINALDTGAIELYFDGSKKIETYSGGVEFHGNLKNETDGVNEGIYLGAANDLGLYHDGTNSYIKNNTGILDIRGDDVRLRSSGGETYVQGVANGATYIYYDSSQKFQTTSTGIKVESGAAATLHLTSNPSYSASIEFGDTDDDDEAEIWYDNYSKKLNFRTTEASDLVFYRNSTEKIRITSDGLTFNGDTAAANAISDYEEGTYTPTLSAVVNSYAKQYGFYTKIGNVVHFTAWVEVSSIGSNNTGTLKLSLPFTSKNSTYYRDGGTFTGESFTFDTAFTGVNRTHIGANQSEMEMSFGFKSDFNEGWNNAIIKNNNTDSQTAFQVSGTYLTD